MIRPALALALAGFAGFGEGFSTLRALQRTRATSSRRWSGGGGGWSRATSNSRFERRLRETTRKMLSDGRLRGGRA